MRWKYGQTIIFWQNTEFGSTMLRRKQTIPVIKGVLINACTANRWPTEWKKSMISLLPLFLMGN